VLTALRGKTKPADALKAILIAYLRFGTGIPRSIASCLVRHCRAGRRASLRSYPCFHFLRSCVARGIEAGSEDRTFKIPQNDPASLEMAAIGAWSLVHGLAMLYIDGLATLETAQTIDSLAEEVIAMFMHGIVKREKQD